MEFLIVVGILLGYKRNSGYSGDTRISKSIHPFVYTPNRVFYKDSIFNILTGNIGWIFFKKGILVSLPVITKGDLGLRSPADGL